MTTSDRIDYPRIIEAALRDAVRRVLAQVAEHGLPGDHHFFLAFRTAHPGVRLPSAQRDLHPDEMQIILQHQFWNLEVGDEDFSVELSFGGRRQGLTVPFAALTAFADPSAELALRFTSGDGAATPAEGPAESAAFGGARKPGPGPAPAAEGPTGAGTESGGPAGRPGSRGGTGGKAGAGGGKAPGTTGGEVIRFDPSRRK
jgi:hypothetical protein